jgi:hypothetical protein
MLELKNILLVQLNMVADYKIEYSSLQDHKNTKPLNWGFVFSYNESNALQTQQMGYLPTSNRIWCFFCCTEYLLVYLITSKLVTGLF